MQSPWRQFFADEEFRRGIEQDVLRTYPEMDFFQTPDVQTTLLTILFCFSRRNPGVSYRQVGPPCVGGWAFAWAREARWRGCLRRRRLRASAGFGGWRVGKRGWCCPFSRGRDPRPGPRPQGMHELLAPLLFVVHRDRLCADTPGAAEASPAMRAVLSAAHVAHDAYALFARLMTVAHDWFAGDGSKGGSHGGGNSNGPVRAQPPSSSHWPRLWKVNGHCSISISFEGQGVARVPSVPFQDAGAKDDAAGGNSVILVKLNQCGGGSLPLVVSLLASLTMPSVRRPQHFPPSAQRKGP